MLLSSQSCLKPEYHVCPSRFVKVVLRPSLPDVFVPMLLLPLFACDPPFLPGKGGPRAGRLWRRVAQVGFQQVWQSQIGTKEHIYFLFFRL